SLRQMLTMGSLVGLDLIKNPPSLALPLKLQRHEESSGGLCRCASIDTHPQSKKRPWKQVPTCSQGASYMGRDFID
ncbi:MAG: hypothetical protein AAF242_21510, partial [Bacteroidota bacterium]